MSDSPNKKSSAAMVWSAISSWDKIKALARACYRPGSAVYAPWELMVMRFCFAWLIWYNFPFGQNLRNQPQPNGIAVFFDLTWISALTTKAWLHPLFYGALGAYVLGVAPFLSTAALFVIHCLHFTARNSQGAVGHSHQIVGLILLGQVIAHVYDGFGAVAKTGPISFGQRLIAPWRRVFQLIVRPMRIFRGSQTPLDHWAEKSRTREIFLSQQMIALTYVVSGISKMVDSEGKWVRNIPNIALQMVKSMKMDYYSDLIAPPATVSDAMIQFIIAYPNWSRLFFSGGLILELFCFVALFNRSIMALWGLGLIIMHQFIGILMSLEFENNVYVLAIYFVNVPFWLMAMFLAWQRRRRPALLQVPASVGSLAGATEA